MSDIILPENFVEKAADPLLYADTFYQHVISCHPKLRFRTSHFSNKLSFYLLKGLAELSRPPEQEPINLRVLINAPPRHGKTELMTIAGAIYFLHYFPTLQIKVVCYNEDLAVKFGGRALEAYKAGLESGILKVPLNPDNASKKRFENVLGGSFQALSKNSGFTGDGVDVLFIDDLIKDAEEAKSEDERDKLWNYVTDTLLSRMQKGCLVYGVAALWHEDDVMCRLRDMWKRSQEEDIVKFYHLTIPVYAEKDDILGRKEGELLLDWLIDEKKILEIKREMSPQTFAANYQQRPIMDGETKIRAEWFENRFLSEIPEDDRGSLIWARGWDFGGADKKRGDPTACVKVAYSYDTDNVYICNVQAEYWESHEKEHRLKMITEMDNAETPCRVVLEQEPGQSGEYQIRHFRSNILPYYDVKTCRPTNSKEYRAEKFCGYAGLGKIYIVNGEEHGKFDLDKYMTELYKFPLGKHDDMVDATVMAFNELTGTPYMSPVGLDAFNKPSKTNKLLGNRWIF